jgi:hypothetical protein
VTAIRSIGSPTWAGELAEIKVTNRIKNNSLAYAGSGLDPAIAGHMAAKTKTGVGGTPSGI